MANEKELIEEMFIQGLLEEESVNVRGIAQLAADKGYDHLTKPQQRVINHILTRACDGVVDSGENYNECRVRLSGEEYLQALRSLQYYEAILCMNCQSEKEGYAAHWERIQAE